MRRNGHDRGKGFCVEAGDGEWQRAADIVGEIGIEIVDRDPHLDRLILTDVRVKVCRDGDDGHNLALLDQRLGLACGGLLERKRMGPLHGCVELLRQGTGILHDHRRGSQPAAHH